MLIDRKIRSLKGCTNYEIDSSLDNKAQRRLFDVYAETKSVKDVFIVYWYLMSIVYSRRCSIYVSRDCEKYYHN